MRVTGVLTARGYNIETLTVAGTLDPELSRMTIVVDVDPTLRAQVIKQMNKLVNVLQAVDLTDSRAVDSSTEGFALEATDDPEKLNEFIQVMRSYGDIEVTRSGAVAVSLESK